MKNRFKELEQDLANSPVARSFTFTNVKTKEKTKKPVSREFQETVRTPSDDQFILSALLFFYPESNLRIENLNDSLRQLAAVMVHDAITASRQMDRVPRPPAGRPSVNWVLKEVVRNLFIDSKSTNVYELVRATIARNRRSEFELARMGLGFAHSSKTMTAVNYQVPGHIPVLQQPSGMSCWATVTTMLYSWKYRTSQSIESVLEEIGPQYAQLYNPAQNIDSGLPGDMKEAFLRDAGFQYDYPMSMPVDGWAQMLQNHGPLWVTTDENPGQGFSIHARLLIGMQGDGSVDGTQMRFIDPAVGRIVTESFSHFLRKFESEAVNLRRDIPLRIQIVYWPAGTGFSESHTVSGNEVPEEETGLFTLDAEGNLISLQMTPGDAVITTTNVQQEINIRLLYLSRQVEESVNNFRNWYNNHTNSKVRDFSPFARFIRGKASLLFKLTGPMSTGITVVYEVMNLAIDQAIRDQIRSIDNFVDQLALRTRNETLRHMQDKIRSVTQESLIAAVDEANRAGVNVHNHNQILDHVVQNHFQVPQYPRQVLWPEFMEQMIEQYLTFYWSEIQSATQRGIMLSSYPNRTFEQVMAHFAREARRIYTLDAISSSDPAMQRLLQQIRNGNWQGTLQQANAFRGLQKVAAGLNTDLQQAIEQSRFSRMEKAMLRSIFSISRN